VAFLFSSPDRVWQPHGACGDGEISASPRGFDGAPTPDQPDAGETCNGSGQCVEGSNWWEVNDRPDATNTGPNCSAPGCPNATLSAANAPPNTITQTICNAQPNCTWENFTKNHHVRIEASGVTLRNFIINGNGVPWSVDVRDTSPNTELLMEYGEINGGGGEDCDANVQGMGWTARYMEIHTCDDNAKVHTNNSENGNGPVLVEHSWLYNAGGGHGDNFQSLNSPKDPIVVRFNSIEGGGTSVYLATHVHTMTIENNWIDWGDDTNCGSPVYCNTTPSGGGPGTISINSNLWDRVYQTYVGGGYCFASGGRCAYDNENRFLDDFSLLPNCGGSTCNP
jgi:hypothetical protein